MLRGSRLQRIRGNIFHANFQQCEALIFLSAKNSMVRRPVMMPFWLFFIRT